MDLSYDSLIELKHHFVGALTQPCPFWLAPAEGTEVGFLGGGVAETPDGCSVDLGAVPALGEEVRAVRLLNLGREPLTLRLEGAPPPWLAVRWPAGETAGRVPLAGAGGAADLELAFRGTHLAEETLQATLRLVAEGADGESRQLAMTVRLRTRLGRHGRFDFNGAAAPERHDFGALDPTAAAAAAPAYTLRIAGAGDAPLGIELHGLPDWLTCEIGGATRSGPAAGRFHDAACARGEVFEATFRPVVSFRFLGLREARVTLVTDDEREELRRVEIELRAQIETAAVYLEALVPEPFFVVPPATHDLKIPLTNWGRSPARLEVEECPAGLEVLPLPGVKGATGRLRGRADLRVRLASEGLAPGPHQLRLVLRVQGSPRRLAVPIRATVVPVEIDPPRLDFGRVGERPERRVVHLRAADGRPLRLRAETLPALAGLLTCSVDAAGALEVEVRPRPETPPGFAHDGPGIVVSEPALKLRREIPVTLRTGGGPGWKIALVLTFLLLAVAALTLVSRHLA